MSYIEKKYKKKIFEIFNGLSNLEDDVLELMSKKSIQYANKIAKLCAHINKEINQILKVYYPEIKEMNDKLEIKSTLKFYYDLIDKITDFIRNVENFQKLDDNYYNVIIDFVKEKETLISGKYRKISTNELTSFYDQQTRENFERILAEKIDKKSKQFFTMGPLEEEIKKIAKISGAFSVTISSTIDLTDKELENASSIISFNSGIEGDLEKLNEISEQLKKFLESKNYKAIIKQGKIITDAKLLPD